MASLSIQILSIPSNDMLLRIAEKLFFYQQRLLQPPNTSYKEVTHFLKSTFRSVILSLLHFSSLKAKVLNLGYIDKLHRSEFPERERTKHKRGHHSGWCQTFESALWGERGICLGLGSILFCGSNLSNSFETSLQLTGNSELLLWSSFHT